MFRAVVVSRRFKRLLAHGADEREGRVEDECRFRWRVDVLVGVGDCYGACGVGGAAPHADYRDWDVDAEGEGVGRVVAHPS